MRTQLRIGLIAFWLSVQPVAAHHAPALYDLSTTVTIKGTVSAFEWVQPHTWLRVTAVDEAGAHVDWSLEGMHPGFLGRRGWSRHTLAPGDVIEARFLPRRDGTPSGMLLDVVLPDGTRKVMAIRTQAPDSDGSLSDP